jgi:putative MATE family efflux protein
MSDLTRGPIGRHIISMAGFIAAGLAFQSAYFLVDLYFVSHIGKDAVAGVSAAGGFFYLALAGAQLIGVGTLSLVSQAIGRKDAAYANLVFNQVLVLSVIFAAICLGLGYLLAGVASAALSADAPTAAFARAYLFGFLPSLASMFPGTAMMSALRAQGVVRPTMLLQTGSVLVNVVLAPVLIAGWGTGVPLGTFGAGLASSIASVGSLVVIAAIWRRIQSSLHLQTDSLRPRLAVWNSLGRVGTPAAGEFVLMFLITAVIYWSLRRYGPAAQAGFGIGARVMQALFLPVMAISFAAAPIAGQNFGAGNRARVIETFRTSLIYGVGCMIGLALFCQIRPDLLALGFTHDPAVLTVATQYLRTVSWNFPAVGVVFACSGMFQALGDTRPSFISSASRLVTFCLPCVLLASWPPAVLANFWLASNISAAVQAGFSLLLLRWAFGVKLPSAGVALA